MFLMVMVVLLPFLLLQRMSRESLKKSWTLAYCLLQFVLHNTDDDFKKVFTFLDMQFHIDSKRHPGLDLYKSVFSFKNMQNCPLKQVL